MDLRLKKFNIGIHQKIQSLDGVHKKTIYRGNCLKRGAQTVCRFKRGPSKEKGGQSLIQKFRAAFDIGQKRYFFKKRPQKFYHPLNLITKCFASKQRFACFSQKGATFDSRTQMDQIGARRWCFLSGLYPNAHYEKIINLLECFRASKITEQDSVL